MVGVFTMGNHVLIGEPAPCVGRHGHNIGLAVHDNHLRQHFAPPPSGPSRGSPSTLTFLQICRAS
jgi:hypothetical protein